MDDFFSGLPWMNQWVCSFGLISPVPVISSRRDLEVCVCVCVCVDVDTCGVFMRHLCRSVACLLVVILDDFSFC